MTQDFFLFFHFFKERSLQRIHTAGRFHIEKHLHSIGGTVGVQYIYLLFFEENLLEIRQYVPNPLNSSGFGTYRRIS